MRWPELEDLSRHGYWLLVPLVLVIGGAVGYRVWRGGSPVPPAGDTRWEGPPAPTAGTAGRGGTPLPPDGPRGRGVHTPTAAVTPPRAPEPPPKPSTREQQTDAIREAVIYDTVKTIRLAARRGDEATIKGLVPGLKYQAKLARRLVDDAMREESNPAALVALSEVMKELN